MRHANVARFGGAALIFGALAFVAVFSYLAARFGYPEVLDGAAADVLPRLLATGAAGRLAWALYAFLPLIWIPAGVGAFHALRHVREGAMRVAMLFAALSAVAMILGLARWPSIHWELAQAYAAGGAGERAVLAAVFAGLNSYLGNYVGEFLGELSFSVFFLLSAGAMLHARSGFPRWLGIVGLFTGVLGLVGMFRNVTNAVDLVAEINNYLLPAWMIAFGIGLWRAKAHALIRLVGPGVLTEASARVRAEAAVPAPSPI
ncbi:MAG TPA: DUF4386 family protein [Longimicrobium sp.]|nr:DUF4386 family protein [Longimicrobium sp.]